MKRGRAMAVKRTMCSFLKKFETAIAAKQAWEEV
jgi:hypothetical protein